MTLTKLDKLEVVAGIANRLEDDLRQLKEWIKTQFENETQNENNGTNLHDVTFTTFTTSSGTPPENENTDNQAGQQSLGHPSTSYFSHIIPESIEITQPKSEPIDDSGDQESEDGAENDEEFILGNNYEPDDPLRIPDESTYRPNEMAVDLEQKDPHSNPENINQQIADSRVECEICHSRHKNRHALNTHRHYRHRGVASTSTIKKNLTKVKGSGPSKKIQKKEVCFICKKSFLSRSYRFDHIQRKHFVCANTGCHLQFPSYETLMEHKRNTAFKHGSTSNSIT